MRGDGSISEKGYLRVFVFDPKKGKKRLRMKHNLVWEEHYGPIPEGFDIHHRDGNKLNNKIDNLDLIGHGKHKTIHIGFVRKRGHWVRPCVDCKKQTKREDMRNQRCRVCYNAFCRRYRHENGISTMRPERGGNAVYVNHGPGWISKRMNRRSHD